MTKKEENELRALIRAAIERNRKFVESMKGETNPQTIAMVNNARGQVEAFEAVDNYLTNWKIALKIMAKGC